MLIPKSLFDSTRVLGTLEGGAELPAIDNDGILNALSAPVWPAGTGPSAWELIRPGESVCLVVSDATRRTATDQVLPVLLAGLKNNGCSLRDISILIACGIHRPPTPEETTRILGPQAYHEFSGRIFAHDPDRDADLVTVGTTRRGHTVRINRRVIEARRVVLLGTASYHYHAGFGGGRKSLVPGVAARDTIAHNHSLTLDPAFDRIHPQVQVGVLDGNPVAEEMFESATLCNPTCIINTVLDPLGRLVGVFSGHLDAAHRAACRLVETISRVNLNEPADLVIASAEPARNWIQSHKALFNASRAVREGGRIVLEAPCPDGIGDEGFRHWIRIRNTEEIYRGLRQSDEILGQTALSTRLRGALTILVTGLSAGDRQDLGIETAPDLQSAIDRSLTYLRQTSGDKTPTCYLMPKAAYTVPFTSARQS